jgi:hypothetical protein
MKKNLFFFWRCAHRVAGNCYGRDSLGSVRGKSSEGAGWRLALF